MMTEICMKLEHKPGLIRIISRAEVAALSKLAIVLAS